MLRFFITIVEALVCFLLQSSVFPSFALAGVVPDVMMILVVSNAFIHGKISGLLTGMLCGLLVDFCFADYIGLYALLYMLIGYAVGFSNKIYDENDYTLPLIFVSLAELAYQLLYFISQFLFRGRFNIGYYFIRFMLPKVIYTVFLSVFLYKLFNFIQKRVRMLRHKEEAIGG